MKGTVFDIKRFSIHDGPGIRSTVFTKGCPLDCLWCQNPEGKINKINLWYFENKCIGCHQCLKVCPEKALSIGKEGEKHILIDRDRCTLCGKCVRVCPAKALVFDGKIMSSQEVIEELLKDRLFYETSGGGITVSGGDPLYQHQFNLEILQGCKERDIHTAIETCLYGKREVLESFIKVVDLFITDIKIFAPLTHKKYTGVYNNIIKNNFEMLAARGVDILVRIPLIPGFTANEKNIREIAAYVYRKRKDIPIELINYNPLAENKYRLMDREYLPGSDLNPFSGEEMEVFKRILVGEGVTPV